MSAEIVKMPSTGIIQKIGNAEERQYLVGVYAGMLGIPASQTHKTEVQAVLGKAVQRSVQYGWQPGVHMHTSGFWRKAQQGETPERQDGKIYSISLIDGEKAWWDSAARWRDERGIDWTPKYKPMSREQVQYECKLQDMPFNDGCYGVYCKIVIKGEIDNMLDLYGIDESTPVMDRIEVVNALIEEIPWAAGVYTGKKRNGNFLSDDKLPTGASAKDVAMRRAGKRAIMQSSLTLIPIDNHTEDQRINQLTAKLREESRFKDQATAMIAQKPDPVREDDGSLMFASGSDDDIIDGEFSDIPGATDDNIGPQSLGEVPELDPNGPVDGDTGELEYAHLYSELHDNAKALVDWSRKLHNDSNGPATKKMLGTLKGCIKAAASEDTRKAVVEILIGTNAMEPGYNVTKKLIDALKETSGRGESKVKRQEYRQDVADIVKYLGDLVVSYRESQKISA